MLVFNLTGLKSTEQILQSKLYLLKRRRPKGGKKREHTSFRLNVGCLPDMASKHQIDISLSRQKPEWHSYDISESVVTCRQIRKGNESLLGLTLEIIRPKGSFRSVSFKRLVKPTSQPFVLIFSEDSQNQNASAPSKQKQDDYGQIESLLQRLKAETEAEEYRLSKKAGKNRRQRERRSIDITKNDDLIASHFISNTNKYFLKYFTTAAESFEVGNISRSDFIKLLRAFIDNIRLFLNVNRQSQDSPNAAFPPLEEALQVENISNTELRTIEHRSHLKSNYTLQKVLLSKLVQNSAEQNGDNQSKIETLPLQKRSRRTISDTLLYSTEEKVSNSSDPSINSIEVIGEDNIETSDIIPKSRRRNRKKNGNRPPKRKKKKKKKRPKNRNRKLPFWWTRHDSRLHAQDMKQLCKRKSLVVDFSQLGWDDWIISPKSYNAHYCDGSCTFPIIKVSTF